MPPMGHLSAFDGIVVRTGGQVLTLRSHTMYKLR
jgi:hypothetical protein